MVKKIHYCEGDFSYETRGPALDECTEDEKGFFYVTNGEYLSYVNFCPYCGEKAPKQITKKIIKKFRDKEDKEEKKRSYIRMNPDDLYFKEYPHLLNPPLILS